MDIIPKHRFAKNILVLFLPSFFHSFLLSFSLSFFFYCEKNIYDEIFFLAYFKVYDVVLLTRDTMLYNRSLYLIHLLLLGHGMISTILGKLFLTPSTMSLS